VEQVNQAINIKVDNN